MNIPADSLENGKNPADLLEMIDHKLDAQPLDGRRWSVMILCLLVLVLDGLDLQLLAYAGPLLTNEWGVNKIELATALALTLVGMAIGAPIGGWLGDRFGLRGSLLLTTVVFGGATLATAWARDIEEIQILRLISGLGFGSAVPNARALAGGWAGPSRRGPVVGLLATGTSIGGVAGGLLCAWLLPVAGWRMTFIVSGGVTLVLAGLLVFYLPESPAYSVMNNKGRQIRELMDRLGLAEFMASDRPAPSPFAAPTGHYDGALFSRAMLRTNLTLWIAFFGAAFAAYAFLSWSPTIFVDAGFTLSTAIKSTAAYSFTSIVGAVLATIAANRVHARSLILPSLTVKFCATVVLAAALGSLTLYGPLIIMGLAGLCIGLAQTGLYVLASHSYAAHHRARAIGLCVGFSRTGGILTVIGGGTLLSFGDSGRLLFYATMALVLLMAMAAMFAFKEPPTGAPSTRTRRSSAGRTGRPAPTL